MTVRKRIQWFLIGAMAVAPAVGVNAATTDPDAGIWRMIVLSGPTQISVAAPSQVTSLDYQAELASIKAAQSRLTTEQRRIIDYWRGGGVLRWNELMLQLVSKANLPPAPNPDGTYPIPDANNPFADPVFPFGNPPYAAPRLQLRRGRAIRRVESRVVLTSISTIARRPRRSTAQSVRTVRPMCRPTRRKMP
jgi:hypothetical protein